MEDPRHAVLAASRKKSGGGDFPSLKIQGGGGLHRQHTEENPRGAGDGADEVEIKAKFLEQQVVAIEDIIEKIFSHLKKKKF
jgi:hypothetical protein